MRPVILVCSLCLLLGATGPWIGRPAASPRPHPDPSFVSPDRPPHYDRVRDYDMLHTVLRLRFDWDARAVEGTVVHRLASLRDSLSALHFDQHRFTFGDILLDGKPAAWTTSGDTLTVFPPHALARGESTEVSIAYRALRPPEGVYWNVPDADYPHMHPQIWTEGSETESHFWFPCYDAPNDKMTTEEFVTADPRFTVVGNGQLVSRTEDPGGAVTWHYRMDVPVSTYLISLVVGEFAEYKQSADGVPILSYVPPDRLSEAARSFDRTPDMLRMLSEVAGMPYPYPAYRQTAVEDFLWGGMENVAATTLTDNTLHPAVEDATYSSESLVVHELSHQWWGDLLTVKNWSELWLAEGFATFCESLYWERAYGTDRMQWDLYRDLRSYLDGEKAGRRPLVTRYYDSTIDIFDSVAYEKGGLVLHMLRRELGDDVFFEVVRTYTREHRAGLVESADLREVAARVSGRPLDRFFDQWVYSAGHPDLEAVWSYDTAGGVVNLDLRQVQKTDALTPLFRLAVDVDLTGAGWTRHFKVDLQDAEQHYSFRTPGRPELFELDRDESLIKTLKETKPLDAWIAQLRRSPAVISRVRAARFLGRKGGARAVGPLREVLRDPKAFWGLRGESALALADVGTPEARAALRESEGEREARVRREVVRALGRCADAGSLAGLRKIVLHEPVTDVRAAAVGGVVAARPEGTYDLLRTALGCDSWRDDVRRAALRGFRDLADPRALDLVLPYLRAGQPMNTRITACGVAAVLASDLKPGDRRRDRVRRALEECLHDPKLEVIQAGAEGLGILGDPAALPALTRLADSDVHRYLLTAAHAAINEIRERGTRTTLTQVGSELQELGRSAGELERKLQWLESRTRRK